jgi:hypothetical protein
MTECLACCQGKTAEIAASLGVKGTPDQIAWGAAIVVIDAIRRCGIDAVMETLCPECLFDVMHYTGDS